VAVNTEIYINDCLQQRHYPFMHKHTVTSAINF